MSRPFGTLSRYTFSRRSTFKQLYFALLDRPALRRVEAIHFTTEAERTEADRPTVLFMSRLHSKKNVRGLLHAWTRVVEQRPDAQLWVAGDGDDAYVQGLHKTVAAHDLSDSVSFLGFVSGAEKQRVLREAWASALPQGNRI